MQKRCCVIGGGVVVIALVLLAVLLVFYLRPVESAIAGPTIIIDHDGGADDAMAIFMALLYEKYFNGPKVIALTTTHGNVNETQVFQNSQFILDIAGRRDIPIYRGASISLTQRYLSDFYFGQDGLGDNGPMVFDPIAAKPEHAVFALIELAKQHEGELTLITIGALTNIALAIRIDPSFTSRLKHLYVAAGNIYSDKQLEGEFNALMDVEAYHIVSEDGDPEKMTVIPFSQILLSHNISREWRENTLGSIPTKIMQAQNSFERISIVQTSYWCLLDPVAMAIALNESYIVEETRYSDHGIDMCGDQRGVNRNNFTSVHEANARVIYSVKEEPYQDFLIKLFSAELN